MLYLVVCDGKIQNYIFERKLIINFGKLWSENGIENLME